MIHAIVFKEVQTWPTCQTEKSKMTVCLHNVAENKLYKALRVYLPWQSIFYIHSCLNKITGTPTTAYCHERDIFHALALFFTKSQSIEGFIKRLKNLKDWIYCHDWFKSNSMKNRGREMFAISHQTSFCLYTKKLKQGKSKTQHMRQNELSWFYLAVINIQLEKTQISARTPGHWRNGKVVQSMPLSSWINFVTVQFQLVVVHICGKELLDDQHS